jgi:myo-inositol catabolism protein IolH
MKIALDPFMHRHISLEELPRKVKELGFDWIELSPRGDFVEWFKAPRVFTDRVMRVETQRYIDRYWKT